MLPNAIAIKRLDWIPLGSIDWVGFH
jgi:hypothetical protein